MTNYLQHGGFTLKKCWVVDKYGQTQPLVHIFYDMNKPNRIAINRIQNKSLCLHNICGYIILYIYKYTHMLVYI